MLDPRIIALRRRSRATYLANVKAGAIKKPITLQTFKEDALTALKDSGVGKITNWNTTMRDIQLMIQTMPGPGGEMILPELVRNELLRLADVAAKTLKAGVLTGEDLICCQQVAGLSELKGILGSVAAFPIWSKRICIATEWLSRLYRRMQEIAIGAPKSGEWLNEANYKWAIVRVRAKWHKPHHKNAYDSWSPVGRLHAYVNLQWKALKEEAERTAVRIEPLLKVDTSAHQEAYLVIKKLKNDFGTRMYEIGKLQEKSYEDSDTDIEDIQDEVDEDEVAQLRRDTYELYSNLLSQVVQEYNLPLTIAASLVYRATYDNGRSVRNTQGFTFMWACFGEEIVAALRFLSEDPGVQLIRPRIIPELAGYRITEGPVTIQEKEVYIQGEDNLYTIGKCSAEDGTYDLRNDKNGQPYLVIPKVKHVAEEPKLKLTGRELSIIGFRFQKLSFVGKDGNQKTIELTKDHVVKLLERSGGRCRAEVDLGINGAPTVYLSTQFGPDWVRFGNIPNGTSLTSDAGFWGQALVNKTFRVSMIKEAKPSLGTLRVELTSIEE